MIRSAAILAWCAALGLVMPLALGWWGIAADIVWLGAWVTRDMRRGRAEG